MENLNDYKGELLGKYKELLSGFETTRQVYDKIINEYEGLDSSEILCTKVVAYVTFDTAVEWNILLTTGKTAYRSKLYYKYETFTLDLNSILVTPGTGFYLVAVTKLGNITSSLMTFTPNSNAIAYYSFEEKNILQYIGTVPPSYTPDSDPYLKCTEITVNIASPLISKFLLSTLDGQNLYESSACDSTEPFILNLGGTVIQSDTVLVIKASLIDGSTTTAELIMQCKQSSSTGVVLDLIGNLNKPLLMYQGIYSATPISTIKCSDIVGYVTGALITNWNIILLDGTLVYTSDTKIEWDTWILNLDSLSIIPGTRFRIKNINPAKDSTSSEILEYVPNTTTVYYEVVRETDTRKKFIYCRGIINSTAKPPVLKCSAVTVYNESLLMTKYSLIKADGECIYSSDRYNPDERWTLDLNTLALIPGVQFVVKANCIAGSDTVAYALLEYDPAISWEVDTAKFTLEGNAFKTVMIYKGVK